MSQQEESTAALDTSAAPCAVHWLPCSINHTGAAPVSSYFWPQAAPGAADAPNGAVPATGAAPQEAAFRGRQLRGAQQPLPEGFQGFVLRRDSSAGNGDVEDRAWATDGIFSEVSYWNHDTPATCSDVQQRTFEWLSLSSAVHAPVSAGQVEARMKA